MLWILLLLSSKLLYRKQRDYSKLSDFDYLTGNMFFLPDYQTIDVIGPLIGHLSKYLAGNPPKLFGTKIRKLFICQSQQRGPWVRSSSQRIKEAQLADFYQEFNEWQGICDIIWLQFRCRGHVHSSVFFFRWHFCSRKCSCTCV
jgi:hypothetical protein